jgi:hypothetical protein
VGVGGEKMMMGEGCSATVNWSRAEVIAGSDDARTLSGPMRSSTNDAVATPFLVGAMTGDNSMLRENVRLKVT